MRSARGSSESLLGETSALGLELEPVDMSVDDDGVVELTAGDELVDESAAGRLVSRWVLPSEAGNAEVDGELAVVGGVYGLEAALGELLFGTEVVCAMVTPAALTSATTAAMLKVLDTFCMFELLFP
ncbi:MAG: hypothetical protein ABW190_13180 [Rhizobacter sp.]